MATDNGPVSGRLRSARRTLQRRRARRGLAQQRRQQRRQEALEPFTSELQSTREELGKIRDEIVGPKDSNAEGKQEALGSTIVNLFGLPSQRDDFDEDGDDDLAVFFGVDQDDDRSQNSPFAALDAFEDSMRGSNTRDDQDPYAAVDRFEDNLPP